MRIHCPKCGGPRNAEKVFGRAPLSAGRRPMHAKHTRPLGLQHPAVRRWWNRCYVCCTLYSAPGPEQQRKEGRARLELERAGQLRLVD